MRCLACDVALSDIEATRKDKHGEFIDLCSVCFFAGNEDFLTLTDFPLLDVSNGSYEDEQI
jgi:hypothetical protein